MAQWCFDRKAPAGLGSDTLPALSQRLLLLTTANLTLGVLVIEPANPAPADDPRAVAAAGSLQGADFRKDYEDCGLYLSCAAGDADVVSAFGSPALIFRKISPFKLEKWFTGTAFRRHFFRFGPWRKRCTEGDDYLGCGFFDETVLSFLEDKGIAYIVAARLTQPLQRALYHATARLVGAGAGLELTELRWPAAGWASERRLIV